MNHKERIYNRILTSHFLGAIVTSKDILPQKISMLDCTADVSIENHDRLNSTLRMNYGDSEYTFHLGYREQEHENKQGRKNLEYVIISIE